MARQLRLPNWGMAKQTSPAVPRWKKAVPDLGAQRELRLDALYRVAAAAFRRNGYHGTSLVDIARELGVSKPTLYYYVANKQDLLFQCHLVAADQAIAGCPACRSWPGRSSPARSAAAWSSTSRAEASPQSAVGIAAGSIHIASQT